MSSALTSSNSKNVVPDDSDQPKALFFNYHEFSVTDYAEIGKECSEHEEEFALCITHFPNTYAPLDSIRFKQTRIVRIPRRYEDNLDWPVFCTLLPGHEPAALVNQDGSLQFVPYGFYENQIYGLSSVSPLSSYLSPEEFKDIVETVNMYLRQGYDPNTWRNIISATFDVLTFNLWNCLMIRVASSPLLKLENYVEALNKSKLFKNKNIRLISPRRSGFLSLDFEIPTPSL
ncbi:Ras modification protein ERF4 [Lachancea thermotolerans]